MNIYRLTDEGWQRVRTAYDGGQDGSLSYECHLRQQRDPQHRYRVMDAKTAERENARREAA